MRRFRTKPSLEGLEDRSLLSASLSGSTIEVQAAAGSKLKTIHAHVTGTFVNTPVSSNPLTFETTIQGQGTTKSFGLVTALTHNTTTVSGKGKHRIVVFTDGTGTLTLASSPANSVTIVYSAKGPLKGTKFKPSGTATITGGTGLFANATGHIAAHGTADLATGTFSLELTVKANYYGSAY